MADEASQGTIGKRETLTGDWGGIRSKLKDAGLTIDFGVTQIMQGNMLGGTKSGCRYTTNSDLESLLDLEKMVGWAGASLNLSLEFRNGTGANGRQGTVTAVNGNELYPYPIGQNVFAISNLRLNQNLFDGRVTIGLGHTPTHPFDVFARDARYQFISECFSVPPPSLASVSPALGGMEADLTIKLTDSLSLINFFVDAKGKLTRPGFSTVFTGGAPFANFIALKADPCNLPGNYRVGWAHTSQAVSLQTQVYSLLLSPVLGALPLSQVPLVAVSGTTRRYDWLVLCACDQYLYKPSVESARGLGAFFNATYTDGVVNPLKVFVSGGLSVIGLVPGRPDDTVGIAGYLIHLSDKIPSELLKTLRDEHGLEFYYNIKLTSGMNLTPDLQVIAPTSKTVGIAVVAGMRLQMWF